MADIKITDSDVIGKTVLLTNGKLATVESLDNDNSRYRYIGKLEDGKPCKWTKYGFGLYSGTSIIAIDPQVVITEPGMYVTNNKERLLIRKPMKAREDGKFVATHPDGHISHINKYGFITQNNYVKERAPMIDEEGGIFFTLSYVVYIPPNSDHKAIRGRGNEIDTYTGKMVHNHRRGYCWDFDGRLSESNNPGVPSAVKYNIKDKFIPFARKFKMKTSGVEITKPGEFRARNGQCVVIEGQGIPGCWYGHVNNDFTNHQIWDKFGRVYVFEKDQWIISSSFNGLDIIFNRDEDEDEPDMRGKRARRTGKIPTFKSSLTDDLPEKPVKLKFETGKRYVTDNSEIIMMLETTGRAADTLLGYNYSTGKVSSWTQEGKSLVLDGELHQLIAEYIEPKTGTAWVNIYAAKKGPSPQVFDSQSAADEDNELEEHARLARVKVEWKEGQFDE